MHVENLMTYHRLIPLRIVRQMLLLCLAILSAYAQVKQPSHPRFGTILGQVVDKKDGQPMTYCSVEIDSTTYGASTDSNGTYVIRDLPPGMYTLTFAYIGYSRGHVDSINVRPSDTVRIDYRMADYCDSWADVARKDIAAGKVRIMVAGLIVLSIPLEDEKRITSTYGFEYDYVGCTFMCSEEYNKVVEEHLTKRNGADWEKRLQRDFDRFKKGHRWRHPQ